MLKGGANLSADSFSATVRTSVQQDQKQNDSAQINIRWHDEIMTTWTRQKVSSPPDSVLIHSCNINTWRKNSAKVLDLLDETSSHVLCLQETATSIEQQRSATMALNRRGMHAVWGCPTPRVAKRTRGWMMNRSACPGVAIVFTQNLRVNPAPPSHIRHEADGESR